MKYSCFKLKSDTVVKFFTIKFTERNVMKNNFTKPIAHLEFLVKY